MGAPLASVAVVARTVAQLWKKPIIGRYLNLLTCVSSVADPDPHSFWSAGSGSALGIRIRIQEDQSGPQK
jgi:hypothetical protein